MALYTPLARLGTFLFPSQGRRISAPAPASPHDTPKRRSAIAACDSPPRCRRRLSFAETDVVIEYAPSSPDRAPALHALLTTLPTLPPARRPAAWADLADLARTYPRRAGLDDPPSLRTLFTTAFGAGDTPPAPLPELTAAATALDAVLRAAATGLAARDEPLVEAVLLAAAKHAEAPALIEPVTCAVLRDDWARVFPCAVARAAPRLARGVLRAVALPGGDLRAWEALLQLLGVCAEAAGRCGGKGGGGLGVTREEAKGVLCSFEQLADRDAGCTESVLRALVPVVADKKAAAAFVVENASAVLSEVSSMHAQNVAVQHACIDLLVALSSPKIFYYAPDL